MKVIEELRLWLQGVITQEAGSQFDGMRILSTRRKGKNKLVLELGPDAEITVCFKVKGKKAHCHSCGKICPGWPYWWRNIAKGKGLSYACRDCVQADRLHEGESETNKPEG